MGEKSDWGYRHSRFDSHSVGRKSSIDGDVRSYQALAGRRTTLLQRDIAVFLLGIGVALGFKRSQGRDKFRASL